MVYHGKNHLYPSIHGWFRSSPILGTPYMLQSVGVSWNHPKAWKMLTRRTNSRKVSRKMRWKRHWVWNQFLHVSTHIFGMSFNAVFGQRNWRLHQREIPCDTCLLADYNTSPSWNSWNNWTSLGVNFLVTTFGVSWGDVIHFHRRELGDTTESMYCIHLFFAPLEWRNDPSLDLNHTAALTFFCPRMRPQRLLQPVRAAWKSEAHSVFCAHHSAISWPIPKLNKSDHHQQVRWNPTHVWNTWNHQPVMIRSGLECGWGGKSSATDFRRFPTVWHYKSYTQLDSAWFSSIFKCSTSAWNSWGFLVIRPWNVSMDGCMYTSYGTYNLYDAGFCF